MTRKIRRRNKSQGADLEAQPEDEGGCALIPVLYSLLTLLYKEVRGKGAYDTSTHTAGRDGEASGSSALVGEADREAQSGPSTRSQAQAPKDGSSDSGGHSTIS